jgi:TonB family protein
VQQQAGVVGVRPVPAVRDEQPNTPEAAGPIARAQQEREALAQIPPEGAVVLPPAAIRKVIDEHQAEIRHCYEIALLRNTQLQGDITVRWTIGPTGAVTDVVIKSATMTAPDVEACMILRIRGWQFPPPTAETNAYVTYPFKFRST